MTEPTTVPPATPAPRFRWKLGVSILTLAIVAQVLLWIRFAEDATYSKMSLLFVWPATFFALTLWWLFLSGVTWRTRRRVVGGIVLAMIAWAAVFRVEGSDGDMVPILAFRWTPTAESRAKAGWQKAATKPTVAEAAPATNEKPEEAPPPEVVPTLFASDDDWPGYRGALRDGIVRGRGFRTNWTEQPPAELWRINVGLGWSSFSVIGDYAITQEQRDEQEAVVCYGLADGKLRWMHTDPVRHQNIRINGGDGPRATPEIVGNLVYTVGGSGVLNCLDTRTGERLWHHEILVDGGTDGKPLPNLEWGVSASPLIVDDLVVVVAGDRNTGCVLAYDRQSGDKKWTSEMLPASYGSLRVEEIGGERQILAFYGMGLAGLSPTDGTVRWRFAWENMPRVNVAQPLRLDDKSLLIGIGYGVGATRLQIDPQAGGWNVTPGWKSTRFKLKFNDAILDDGHAYGLDDGILTCLDVETGKTKWKGGRFGYGQMLLFQKTLLILAEDGDVVLAAAQTTKFEELARIKSIEGTTWNHPAVAHGKLLVRNGTTAVCYDVTP